MNTNISGGSPVKSPSAIIRYFRTSLRGCRELNWDLPAGEGAKKLAVTDIEEAKGKLIEIHREYTKLQMRMNRIRMQRDR